MDNSALEEESLAIVSIYGPSAFYPLPSESSLNNGAAIYALKVSLEEPDFDYDPTAEGNTNSGHPPNNRKELELRVYFPQGYPESNVSTPPLHEIVSIYYGTLRLTDTHIQEIGQGLESCFVPGEVIVFSWIEWLRSYLEQLEEQECKSGSGTSSGDKGVEDMGGDDAPEALNKATTDYFASDEQDLSSPSTALLHSTDGNRVRSVTFVADAPTFQIKTGAPIVDRKSVFVAHLAPITQAAHAPVMIQQLKQENKKVIKATHNIMAFRIENENGTIAQGKWYGGIPLSADRFKHINNAARQLLDECGYIKQGDAGSSSGTKKKGGKNDRKK
ncbi:hypothetical protein BGW38_003081 [Lunasporangiospora selenospora]|uniref:RWD domain-containing protein n=1 Tax=Lunasporangiospora selenospora TaxID=979761 RepID=A0A9P6G129_9FUNG|nr:hypothetical protein BGW38_003081 [Lunasporangiospora selenospora]